MLDLDARVDLEHVEVLLLVHQELARGGAGILRAPDEVGGRLGHLVAPGGIHTGRGSLLDELLVAALRGAVALVQVHRVAVLVAEHLDLDVAGVLEELLDVHGPVAESGFRLLACRAQRAAQAHLIAGDAHAASPAAGCRLDGR